MNIEKKHALKGIAKGAFKIVAGATGALVGAGLAATFLYAGIEAAHHFDQIGLELKGLAAFSAAGIAGFGYGGGAKYSLDMAKNGIAEIKAIYRGLTTPSLPVAPSIPPSNIIYALQKK